MNKKIREDKPSIFSKLGRMVSDLVYSGRVSLHQKTKGNKPTNAKTLNGIAQRKTKNLIFYCILMAWPVAQFCIFYLGVNINSILMAFQTYNVKTFSFEWYGFKNFEVVFKEIATNNHIQTYSLNSLLYFAMGLVTTVLALFFSYYIYKKMLGHKFFRLVLYLPSIISPIVIGLIYSYFTNMTIPNYLSIWTGKQILIKTTEQKRLLLILYNILMAFGVNVLMYSSSMSSIDDSVIESCQLDGAKPIREFFSIVLPLIYPTVATFLAVSIAGIFTNQFNLFSLYGDKVESDAPAINNLGYFLYMKTYWAVVENAMESQFVVPATWGIVFTAVAAPITLVSRWALNKFGPSAD